MKGGEEDWSEATGWCGETTGSGGNLYVVDMFMAQGDKVDVRMTSDVYWRERNK
jgi:hypothetical protein